MIISKNRLRRLGLAGGLAIAVSALGPRSSWADDPDRVTILFTNDIHARFTPAAGNTEESDMGGFEALSHYVQTARQSSSNSLLLDAGDLMTGSMICELKYEGAHGGALIEMMNRIGYDAMTPGNHEFDISASNFKALQSIAEFDIICANMMKGDSLISKEKYHIYSVGELEIGVIGMTYYPMLGMVPGPRLEGYDSLDPLPIIDSLIAEIDPETDLIVLLSHLGLQNDRKLARNSRGLDLIVGGHSHSILEDPVIENGVVIVQAGSGCRFLGRIDLDVIDDKIDSYNSTLIAMLTKNISPDPVITEMVDRFEKEIEDLYGTVIGQLKERWEIEQGTETNVGLWLTGRLKERLAADVAIINTGAIRKSIGPGEISIRDILEMLPFKNEIVTFECSGRGLAEIASKNLDLSSEGYLFPLQISGLTIKGETAGSGIKADDILIDEEALREDGIYTVASIDYLVIHNAARYFGFEIPNYYQTGLLFTDIVIDEIKKTGIIESQPGTR